MIKLTPISVSSLKIAVTSTSSFIYDLMDTAGSVASKTNENYYISKRANALIISPEDGDVRMLSGADPTSAVGTLLKSGGTYYFAGVNLSQIKLIRTGGSNVSCSVEPCISEPSEGSFSAAAGGGTGSSASQVQGNVASDAADSGNPVKVGGVHNSTKPTVADGDRVDWQMTNRGEGQVVEQYAPAGENNPESTSAFSERFLASNTYAKSASQNNSFQTFNAKAGAGTLIYVNVINTAASVRYLQTHNTTTTPSGGATAANKWLIKANDSITLGAKELAGNGIYHSTGVAFANSSTATTYTAGVAGDLLLEYVVV